MTFAHWVTNSRPAFLPIAFPNNSDHTSLRPPETARRLFCFAKSCSSRCRTTFTNSLILRHLAVAVAVAVVVTVSFCQNFTLAHTQPLPTIHFTLLRFTSPSLRLI
ncbi:hypothetical protein GQ42DRAFT_162148, partial [Ramicandelaber brevisporus]